MKPGRPRGAVDTGRERTRVIREKEVRREDTDQASSASYSFVQGLSMYIDFPWEKVYFIRTRDDPGTAYTCTNASGEQTIVILSAALTATTYTKMKD